MILMIYIQVRPITDTPTRIQIGGSHQRSTTDHVSVSTGPKARLTLKRNLVFSQIYA